MKFLKLITKCMLLDFHDLLELLDLLDVLEFLDLLDQILLVRVLHSF
jgi:hypothetical protein